MARHEGRLHPTHMLWTEHQALVVEKDPKVILDPGYWSRYVNTVKPRDLIHAEAEDASWSATVRVMGVDREGERVIVMPVGEVRRFDPGPIPSGFVLDFVSFLSGWRILREDGRAPLRSNFATAFDAAEWLRLDRGPIPGGKSGKA